MRKAGVSSLLLLMRQVFNHKVDPAVTRLIGKRVNLYQFNFMAKRWQMFFPWSTTT